PTTYKSLTPKAPHTKYLTRSQSGLIEKVSENETMHPGNRILSVAVAEFWKKKKLSMKAN
uniref:hypothetical protein n=1 Tax=Corynebacterium casei TaxID=160386 RepID=UPI001C6FCB01